MTMFNRQRVIIEMLRYADRPVSHLELTKWSFLLRHETETAGGSAFYDFLPYRYGPFSFSLFQELDKLAAMAYVRDADQQLTLGTSCETNDGLPRRVALDAQRLVRRVRGFSQKRLIQYVYQNYPAYTINSEIRRLAERPRTEPMVYTAGYEGRSVDAFLHLLVENGIDRLIDVRMNPIARRYGFHRSTLARLSGKLGIDYEHVPSLGIASAKRTSLNTGDDYNALFDDYEKTTLREETAAIEHVSLLVEEKPSVLVCMEANHKCCHRSRLARAVARRTRLPVKHLPADDV